MYTVIYTVGNSPAPLSSPVVAYHTMISKPVTVLEPEWSSALPFCTEFRRTSFVVLRLLASRLPHPAQPPILRHESETHTDHAPQRHDPI